MLKRCVIRVKGIVQGVGFRPFIYRLALETGVKGFVLNDTEGVLIDVEAEEEVLKEFLNRLKTEFPPLAVVQEIIFKEEKPCGYKNFVIKKSQKTSKKDTFIPPDTAVCQECLREFFDPKDRRYLYPFIVCTHCGPRFSIVKDLPYDRENTSMAEFPMCNECRKEYEDPLNRRFHTQPTACPVCGPKMFLWSLKGELLSENPEEIAKICMELIKKGHIIAIKGVGGFHLACNACNSEAVLKLRERKKRPFKPFALMVGSVEKAKEFLEVSPEEEELLLSKERPIVILKKKKDLVSEFVAPGLSFLGVMLPYAPFHHLLFKTDEDAILVMTSGNLSEEPICYKDEEAFERLRIFVDYFVTYNREIIAHSDDSVMFVLNKKSFFIRRARGFVPVPILLRTKVSKHIFASGGDLKNTFAIAKDNKIIISQHLGDLESPITQELYEKTVNHFLKVFDVKPEVFVCDMHPRYFTTRITEKLARGKPVIKVQHHHAHIVSVMVEHEIYEPVIGIAFDGTGFGTDGKIWGGEFFIADRKGFKRYAHFSYFMLPGGEKAIKEVWRIGLSLLYKAGLSPEYLSLKKDYPINIIWQMLEKRINSPEACSVGRLFDGVSALLGVCEEISTEAEAPQLLEELARRTEETLPLNFSLINKGEEILISVEEFVRELVKLRKEGTPVEVLARTFHEAIISTSLKLVSILRERTGIKSVVLSGGAFQNRILLLGLWQTLKNSGFKVLLPQKVPFNDGGICLGQIGIAQKIQVHSS
ncbi:MAG: carbamoyltransferase HypF [Thermodesulfobacteria bacterium]|nr:carbamoyltransferase HypF [Thermodesulfobacteriota bacterium]